MTREDFIRQFVLKYAELSFNRIENTISLANKYADLLFPTDPEAKHKIICKLLRNCNLQKLAAMPTEERYTYLSEVLDTEISDEEIQLFSHMK